MDNKELSKRIKVLKTDRNEVRFHVHSDTITVMYKSRSGLENGWNMAKRIIRGELGGFNHG